MPISENFTSVYSKDWEINFLQCNPNGYLKYTDLCHLLQLTAGHHAEAGNLSFTDMQQHDQAWVLSRMRLEITELPKWRDTVTITTWIMDLHGSRSIRALEVAVNGKKMIGCITYWAVFNTRLRKSEALALPYEHFQMFPDRMPTAASFSKINFNRETEKVCERKVVISDLDVVNHVNNVKYLEWCLDEIDPELILQQKISSIDMNFLREMQWNDAVIIDRHSAIENILFTVSGEGKICFAAQLNL